MFSRSDSNAASSVIVASYVTVILSVQFVMFWYGWIPRQGIVPFFKLYGVLIVNPVPSSSYDTSKFDVTFFPPTITATDPSLISNPFVFTISFKTMSLMNVPGFLFVIVTLYPTVSPTLYFVSGAFFTTSTFGELIYTWASSFFSGIPAATVVAVLSTVVPLPAVNASASYSTVIVVPYGSA